jgi:nucleotide-binding universal stress UspA family protein
MNIRASGPFRSILFPTDFSKSSEAIADHAAGIAKAVETKVWLLSIEPWLEAWHGSSESYFGPFTESARVKLEHERQVSSDLRMKTLERLQKQHFSSVESECCVLGGGVAETVVEFAKEKDVGMIMMATRGFGPKRRFMIGSTTAKVLHDAPCAVWTSPHPCELGPFHPYRNIVIAMNYRKLSADLLVRASEVAGKFGANLSVYTAIPTAGSAEHGLFLKMKQEIAATIKSQLAREKLKASVHLIEGDPGEVIGQVATEIAAADLIITGRGHLDEAAGHLRTHNYEIIWNAPCPVITL